MKQNTRTHQEDDVDTLVIEDIFSLDISDLESLKSKPVESIKKAKTPDELIELIKNQLSLIGECRERVKNEGIVVRNVRGDVVPHPALEIERLATKLAADLMSKAV